MADYSRQINNALALIAAKGGVIVFDRAPEDSIPADPEAPWEGNSEPGEPHNHVGVLLPLAADERTTAESNHRVLIPAKGLPFEIFKDMEFTDAVGRKFAITAVTELAPDPAQVILYDCECALWPQAS